MPGVKRRSGDNLGLCSTLSGLSPSTLDNTGGKRRRTGLGSDDTFSDVLSDRSVLMKSLKEACFFVKTGSTVNILAEDQAIFLKKFVKDVTTQENYPDNIDLMTETLGSWLEDEVFLTKCLTATDTSLRCDTARSSKQDSLIRLLLNVEDLQPKLLTMLLEKLAETSIVQEGQEETQTENIPRLLLASMRWLDRIVDGRGMADKMTEILSVTSKFHQVEVIAALPEIVPATQHNTIAANLHQMLEDNQPLVSSIVDCLGNLDLTPDHVQTTKDVLIRNMANSTFQLSELPAVIEYLLSSHNRKLDSLNDLVKDLRDHLELTSKVRPSQRVGPSSVRTRDNRDNNYKKSIECIILDKINIAMLTERKMFDAWINALESVKEAEEMKPLDLLIIVIMYKNKQRRKTVEALLKSKIRNGILTEDLIVSTFEKHPTALKQWMTQLQDIADILITSPDKTISEGPGKQIFVSAFVSLGETCQREIVAQMVTLVSRADTALSVLAELSREHGEMLARYGWYLVGLLDQISEATEVGKVRNIIGILVRLAWRKGASTTGQQIRDDIVIFVKKQVQSGMIEYKRMGVVGGVVVAQAMATAAEEEDIGVPIAESSRASRASGAGTDTSIVLSVLGKEAWDLLEFTEAKVSNHPALSGLFYDEMCISFIDKLDGAEKSFVDKFVERFSTNVEGDYIEDLVENEHEIYGIKMSCEMLLDDDEEDSEKPISLALAPKVCKAEGIGPDSHGSMRIKMKTKLATLNPRLRLLCKTIGKANDGDLGNIDALLGCGIWTFPEGVLRNIDDLQTEEKTVILNTLFYAINWFIELVNGFGSQKDDDVRRKVLIRIKQIIELRKSLQSCLRYHPTYKPPTVLFSENVSDWVPPSLAEKSKKSNKSGEKKDKKGGKGKKSKAPTETMMNATMNLNTQRISQDKESQQSKVLTQKGVHDDPSYLIVDLQHYKPFFRELDLSYLDLLVTEPLTTESAPLLSEETHQPRLRPPEFLLMMKDLHSKLDKSLFIKKKGFPGKSNLSSLGFAHLNLLNTRDIVTRVMTRLKHIFSHLDSLRKFFERLSSVNDESVDLITLCQKDSLICLEAVKATFTVLQTFFSWPGFANSVHEDLLGTSLFNIVNRFSDIGTQTGVALLTKGVIKYLEPFSDCSLDIEAATAHASLMSVLAGYTEDKKEVAVANQVETYLKKEWKDSAGDPEKGSMFNSQIEKLLVILVANSSDIYEDLLNLCNEGTNKSIHKESVEMFPFINKGTMAVVYKVVLSSLVLEVKKMTYGSTKDPDVQFEKWSKAVTLFVKMVLDLKTHCTRGLLTQVLKNARPFLDHFVKEGMTLVEKNFRNKREDCVKLIGSLQRGTRYLQNICGHAKIEQDVALSAKVPLLKKSLDSLIITTKAMLAANNSLEAFELGTLKNKDLKGHEIQTQLPDEELEVEEEEEEEEEGDEDNEGEEEELVLNDNDISEEI